MGMLVLIAESYRNGMQVVLRYPETYLHPIQQLVLADLMLALSAEPAESLEH